LIDLVYAHPYPSRSRATAALLSALEGIDGLEVRSLYDLYPDFDIDIPGEQAALARAQLVVWLYPTYWYAPPGLMKHWFDQVLAKGWAYDGGTALAGKDCLWVTTTGGSEADYAEEGSHGHAFAAFVPMVEQTARFCGMNWLEPFIVNDAHVQPADALREAGKRLRERVAAYSLTGEPSTTTPAAGGN
jgi:glutathione-regulated potassium-efflux system ancillary protein KefF